MELDKNIFIINNLEKSKTALSDAKFTAENDRLTTALNRIYYSIFYSVVSLGYMHDFITVKHKQLMGWFNKKFIYEDKIFEEDLFTIYKEAFKARTESDYAWFSASKEEVEKRITEAEKFTKTISNYILKKLNKENK